MTPGAEAGRGAEFRRVLGPIDAASLVAGSMVGTGIFVFVADVATALPPSPLALIGVWVLGAVVAGCGALCLAELAAADPRTGGIYVYLVDAYGPLVGFLYGWCKFLIMRVASFAIPALLFAGFAANLAGLSAQAAQAVRVPLAVGAVLALTAINCAGVRAGAAVQVALTLCKLLALVAIVVAGVLVASHLLDPRPVALPPAPPRPSSLWAGVGTAMVAVMWTYGGWDESPFVAEEVRDPTRNLPRSILGGLGLVALLFILVNGAYLVLLSDTGLAASGELTATFAMQRALGPRASTVMTVVLMLSTVGVANGMALTGARIAFAAGRDQRAFRWFATTHPRTQAPVRGLVTQAMLVIGAILLLEDPFELLLFTGLAYWIFSGATALAVVRLRRRDPERVRPFRVWGYPFTPFVFGTAALAMAATVVVDAPTNALATLAILAVGVAAYRLQGTGDVPPTRPERVPPPTGPAC